jgi:hypothetical protein
MPMTPEEFAEKLRAIYSYRNSIGAEEPERTHEEADCLIIELLKAIGYSEGAQLFEESERWYA